MPEPFPRISAQIGSPVDLNVIFLRNGVPTDPFAIRRIDIFASAARDENLVAQIILPEPTDPSYPSPLVRPLLVDDTIEVEDDCPDETAATAAAGHFSLIFDIPCDFEDGIIYHDVWYFIPVDCGEPTGFDFDDESLWQSQCNRFFVFSDGCFVDDQLIIPRFAFEPLDFRLRKGEIRTIEVGIMPLPLYDFDFNRIMPIIPQFKPHITIETDQCEILVNRVPGRMGLRQGSFRTNPFNAQFTLDTSTFLKGTYVYRVEVDLPNGETRISDDFRLSIH